MSAIKALFSQTIVYGVSTILVRMINWALTPFYSYAFKDPTEFGIMNNLYAYIAFLNIIYMYGMETGFFRFATDKENRTAVFRTVNGALITTSFLFTAILLLFANPIALFLGFPGHTEYIELFALILFFDNIVNIPFALLRMEGRPGKFLQFKLINVGVNVLLNFFFFYPALIKQYNAFDSFGFVHEPDFCVYYVFIANLVASVVTFLCFLPQLIRFPPTFSTAIFVPIWKYASPLIIVGLAGMINELSDREMLKRLLKGSMHDNLHQLGLYSAVYKLSIFMTLAIQGFRMGAEPFFFKYAQEKNAPHLYAQVLTYFSIVCLFIFLVVNLFSHEIILLLDPAYREALPILPILLFANFCLGLYYNISAWYRIKDKTIYGTYITLSGAAVTLIANFILIPFLGYYGAAITHALTYVFMTALCYFIGQQFFPVPYAWKKIGGYLLLALILSQLNQFIYQQEISFPIHLFTAILFSIVFLAIAWKIDIRAVKNLGKENA